MKKVEDVIDEARMAGILEGARGRSAEGVEAILSKGRARAGLTPAEAARLLFVEDEEGLERIFEAAGEVKREIYGERLVLFAPLYVSNFCVNDCAYCGFHRTNEGERVRLSTREIAGETRALIEMGHKRVLLECGEHPGLNTMDFVTEAISTIYSTKSGNGEIRRINVNIAPPGPGGFRRLKAAQIGTYQLFQETYHRETYEALHGEGPKADYARQLFAHDAAFEAGIDDVGLGVLFGLHDYRFEVLGLISHALYLERTFGVGPHTVSVPRLRPAPGVSMERGRSVTDQELLKIIAVLRLTLPYTGIILSTREREGLRARGFEIGVSQASAGSAAAPGGYGARPKTAAQFSLGDERTVEGLLKSALASGILPSFCTACYRRERTGEAFMALARPGDIASLCRPNAILTFKEYLEDYAAADVREEGGAVIDRYLPMIGDAGLREETKRRMRMIEAGRRDLFF
ncbi:MAG: [FeFe] hydrogenase H-cluster radical SAM maturase HydG [Thermodesulfobacteriota bacterium]